MSIPMRYDAAKHGTRTVGTDNFVWLRAYGHQMTPDLPVLVISGRNV